MEFQGVYISTLEWICGGLFTLVCAIFTFTLHVYYKKIEALSEAQAVTEKKIISLAESNKNLSIIISNQEKIIKEFKDEKESILKLIEQINRIVTQNEARYVDLKSESTVLRAELASALARQEFYEVLKKIELLINNLSPGQADSIVAKAISMHLEIEKERSLHYNGHHRG